MSTPALTTSTPTDWEVTTTRIFAGYFVLQAVTGVIWWTLLATSEPVREFFEMMPGNRDVLSALVFGDLLCIVGGSILSAYALSFRRTWAVVVVAFTAGGVFYATLYLVGWVAFAGEGEMGLAIMVGICPITCWIAWQVWTAHRTQLPSHGTLGVER